MIVNMINFRKRACGIIRNDDGGPLAEFALLVPFLILLLFAAFEFARLLFIQSLVTKSTQDAARYLARSPALLAETSCPPTGAQWATAVAAARQVAARGDRVAASSLIYGPYDPVSNAAQLTITVTCESTSRNGQTLDSTLTGGIPIIVVSANLPVADIGFFGFLGITGSTFAITAEHREMAIGL